MFIILITLSCANAAQVNETNIGIDSIANQNNQISDINAGDFSTLDYEINASIQTKTLNLTKDYAYNPENDEAYRNGIGIDIDDLVIDGQGHTINANNQAGIFNIRSKNVVLKK